jgi:sugar lactone lactonase YvrE
LQLQCRYRIHAILIPRNIPNTQLSILPKQTPMHTPIFTTHREPQNMRPHHAVLGGARLLRYARAMACLALAWLASAAPVAMGQVTRYAFSNFAVGGPGSADGMGSAARFNFQIGAALDAAGNVYVADTGNHTIRKVTPAGLVTTFAGTAGRSGSVNGTGAAALFNNPQGVAVDTANNLYVADTGNHTIRKITPGGTVTTLAGFAGVSGSLDGTGTAATFYLPSSVAVDGAFNVYVADTRNYTIRKITPAGVVTTLAGSPGQVGSTDAPAGPGSVARFNNPQGVAVDPAGNVFVGDTGNHTIRTITPAGVVSTLAGTTGLPGSSDGIGIAASFNLPSGVALDAALNLYVADTGNHIIRKIAAGSVVTTLAGTATISGAGDGVGPAAQFYNPAGLTVNSGGTNVYVADTFNLTIRKVVTATGAVTTLAGMSGGTGIADGAGTAARFNDPEAMVVDPAGNTYVVDKGNHTIRKITPAGVVTTFAGSAGNPGSTDGIGTAARFSSPSGLSIDPVGNLYVADTGNHTIRKITPAGVVSTFAGLVGTPGSRDGLSAAASGTATGAFTSNAGYPIGTTRIGTLKTGTGTINPGDKLVIAGDSARYTVVGGTAAVQGGSAANVSAGSAVIPTPAGSTAIPISGGTGSINVGDYIIIAGVSGRYLVTVGAADVTQTHTIEIAAPGLNTALDNPAGLTVVGSSFVIAAPGLVKPIPALSTPITLDSGARLNSPQGVAADAAGNVYIADTGNHTIRLVTLAGALTTFTGTAGSAGSRDGEPALSKGTATGAFTATGGFAAGSTLIRTSNADGSGTIIPGDVVTFSGDPNRYVVTQGTASVRGGNAVGAATTAAGFAIGDTYIATSGANGSGAINAGDFVTFAGDTNVYLVATGTSDVSAAGAGSFIVLASPGLKQAISTAVTNITVAGSSITIASPGLYQAIPASKTAITLVTAAQFNSPQCLALDVAGNLYVADVLNNTIRKVSPTGTVTTLAGAAGISGTTDGTGTAAQFKNPKSLALDAFANVYVADTGNHTIRKITPAGLVTTIGGGAGILGSIDGTGIQARFYNPSGVAVDAANKVFVADSRNNRISRGTPFLAFGRRGNTDLNGDGSDDLVFQNSAGQLYGWYLNGVGGVYSYGWLFTGALGSWTLVGIADMNNDGNVDFIFQYSSGQVYVWYLNGSGGVISTAFLSTLALGDWRVVGVADMDNDGNADLVFQNTIGQIYVWRFNGAGGFLSGFSVPAAAAGIGDWRVVGLADIDRDGNVDIIFQNTIGQIYAWRLNGSGGFLSGISIYPYGSGGWRVARAVDINGDGYVDLVFQNSVGQIYVWLLNGTGGITSTFYLYTSGTGDFRIK